MNFDPESIAFLIPIVALMIPIVAILTKHQREMAAIVNQRIQQPQVVQDPQLVSEIQRLRQRVEALEGAVVTSALSPQLGQTPPAMPTDAQSQRLNG